MSARSSRGGTRERLNLVTGGTGFSAAYVIRELVNAGQRVIATDRASMLNDPERREVLRLIGVPLDHPNLQWVAADLLEPRSLEPLFARPLTHVFHTASLYDYSAPQEILRRVNVEGTRNLLALAVKAKLIRFVHWSTCGVLGAPFTTRHGPRVNIPFTERSPSPKSMPFGAPGPTGTHLVNAYSVSKWEQEQWVWRAQREEGLPVTVIRPGPMYGPGSNYGHGGIILAMARGLVRGIPSGSRHSINASVHVEDLARFACHVAEHPQGLGEDYNVVDKSVISYHEFLHYMALLVGRRLRDWPVPLGLAKLIFLAVVRLWTWLERVFGIPRLRMLEPQSAVYIGKSYWFDNRKTLETGFTFKYPDVREGLKQTVAWMREVGWLYAADAAKRRALLLAPRPKRAKPLPPAPPDGSRVLPGTAHREPR